MKMISSPIKILLLTIKLLFVFSVAEGSISNLGCSYTDGRSFSALDQTISDVCCPPTKLHAPYKEKRVDIGLIGWTVDPLVGALHEELKDQFLSNKTGCAPRPLTPLPVAGKWIPIFNIRKMKNIKFLIEGI